MIKIKAGIIGLGMWGQKLFSELNNFKDVEIIGICDRSKSLFKKDNIQHTTEYQYLLDNYGLNAVFIATSASSHFQIAKDALKAKINVFVEKPITTSGVGLQQLIALSKAKSLIVQSDLTYIYSEEIKEIKNIIDDKLIGKILYVESRRTGPGKFQPDCNILWDLGIHDAGIYNYLFGIPTYVQAMNRSIMSNTIMDCAEMNIGNNNFKMHTVLSWVYPEKTRRITIFGSKGIIVYDDLSNHKLVIYKGTLNYENITKLNENIKQLSVNKYYPKLNSNTPLYNSSRYFIDSVRRNKSEVSRFEIETNTVKIIEKANYALKKKSKIVRYD
jgi:predicted dehydrogenase